MGRRYYCDYCDKTMPCTPSIIKTHNGGLSHQKMVQEHYQEYKDPEQILAEESTKRPCSRFLNGECHFGSVCRYSHYTREQLDYLQQYVSSKNMSRNFASAPSFQDLYEKLQEEKSTKNQELKNSTVLVDRNGITHNLPWRYNSYFDNYRELPLSLKRITLDNFSNVTFNEWG